MIELSANIPRMYTALAQWIGATLYIYILWNKESKKQFLFIAGVWFVLQEVLLNVTADVPLFLWIPVMLVAVFSIFGYMKVGVGLSNADTGFCVVRIFVFAEFVASLTWQIYTYFVEIGMKNNGIILMAMTVIIYAGLYVLEYVIDIRKISAEHGLATTRTEIISAVAIAITIFAVSNLSFIQINTPFSGNTRQEIYYIRTLVDFCGVLLLFSQQDERQKRRLSYEKKAMDAMLIRQYEQYKMSSENIAMLNMKYHDLKHQILAIRQESDMEKREKYLKNMEDGIKIYETQFQTGNEVLDILVSAKSEYCRVHDIHFTCMADGTLVQFMDKMDLCTLFGNALDNAIENVMQQEEKEKRLISMSINAKGQFIMVRIENYSNAQIDSRKGFPKTTKTELGEHGIGMRSMELIVQRYGGAMTFKTENNWFFLNVLFSVSKQID